MINRNKQEFISTAKNKMAIFKKAEEKNPYKELQVGMEDAEVLKIISLWNQRGSVFATKLQTEGKRNYKYFIGKYDRDMNIPVGKSNIVDNRIFSAIKSVVAFVTSKPAQPVCYSKTDAENKAKTEESKFISTCTQDILKKLYADAQVQKLNEQNSINRYIYKIGLLRFGLKDGKLFTRVVNPSKVIFDEGAKTFKESVYIGEPVEYTAEELVMMFPDKKAEIMKEIQGKSNMRICCIEWWTEKVVCVTIDTKVVLNLKKNPLINDESINLNYYQSAPIPYVALNVYNIGEQMIDDTSEIDQTYLMQDALNDITRATVDNVKFCGNPIKVATGLNAEQVSLIGGTEPGDSLLLGKDQTLTYLQATGMPAFVENTQQNLKIEIDAVFGTQATFRGEYEGDQSGVSRDILRQQAADSLAQLSRGIERMMDDLYRGWLHLIMVYADDPEFVKAQIKPILADRTKKFVDYLFNNDDGIEVSVLPGTIIPDDPVTIAAQAIELAGMNRITNTLLYESLKIPNAEEEADKLDLNETTIAIRSQEIQQRATQKEQENAAMTSEADSINQQIDALGADASPTAPPGVGGIPAGGNAPVNIQIGSNPDGSQPIPNVPAAPAP